MNKSITPFLVVLAVLSLAGILYFSLQPAKEVAHEETKEPLENGQTTQEVGQKEEEKTTPQEVTEASSVKTIEVIGTNYAFSPKEIKVAKGTKVKISFVNKEGFHDFVIDEFKAKTKQISAGKTETIEFIADKIGIFEYYCSVGSHRKMGMWGKLIVE